MRFSPEGDVIASGSHDKHIFMWRTYGECENYMMLKGAWVQWVGWGGGRSCGLWRSCAACAVSALAWVLLGVLERGCGWLLAMRTLAGWMQACGFDAPVSAAAS